MSFEIEYVPLRSISAFHVFKKDTLGTSQYSKVKPLRSFTKYDLSYLVS